MIYTLTANPCIDYFLYLQAPAKLGAINRARQEDIRPGGKGVNVSVMLQRLGEKTCTTGFAAGESGDFLEALLKKYGCTPDFVRLPAGQTRINVKLEDAPETAFNGKGPDLDEGALDALMEKLSALTKDDTLVISGNLQGGSETYVRLAALAAKRGAQLVVDTTGEALAKTLPFKPFLIKPNEEELAELFGEEAETLPQIIALARRAQRGGARNVLVSMGGDGSLLAAEDGTLWRAELTGRWNVISTVGAGDSLTAGFLAGWAQSGDHEAALRLGSAAGTATACDGWLAEKDKVDGVLPYVTITKLEG